MKFVVRQNEILSLAKSPIANWNCASRRDTRAPRPQPRIDARRAKLVQVYSKEADLDDLRKITSVPPSLRSGHDDEVSALLLEVHRALRDLLPAKKCARLVARMCKHKETAKEWLACFGAP